MASLWPLQGHTHTVGPALFPPKTTLRLYRAHPLSLSYHPLAHHTLARLHPLHPPPFRGHSQAGLTSLSSLQGHTHTVGPARFPSKTTLDCAGPILALCPLTHLLLGGPYPPPLQGHSHTVGPTSKATPILLGLPVSFQNHVRLCWTHPPSLCPLTQLLLG